MTMQKATFLLVICSWIPSLFLFSQSNSSDRTSFWSEKKKLPMRAGTPSFMGTDSSTIYLARKRTTTLFGKKYIAEKHTAGFKEVSDNQIYLKYNNKEMLLEHAAEFGNKLLYFSTIIDPKLHKNLLYVTEVTKQNLAENSPQKIAEAPSRNKLNTGKFEINFSRDTSKLLIYSGHPKEKDANERFSLKLLDQDLSVSWEQSYQLEYSKKLFQMESIQTDNQGNAFLMGILYRDKVRDKKKGEPNYEYIIFNFRKGEAEPIEYHVDLKDKFISDMNFEINEAGDIVCGGFYSQKGTFSIKGTFFFIIDGKSGKIATRSTKEFGMDFLARFMSTRKAKKKKELYEYDLKEIHLRKDGGATLIAEQYYVKEVITVTPTPTGGSQTNTTTYYHYNDIILANFNADAEIEWIKKIPKTQVTTNDEGLYSSFMLAKKADTLFFLYNDHPDNDENRFSKKAKNFNPKKSVAKWIAVSPEGEMTQKVLFNPRKLGILLQPKICTPIPGDEMLLYGEKKRKFRLARMPIIGYSTSKRLRN